MRLHVFFSRRRGGCERFSLSFSLSLSLSLTLFFSLFLSPSLCIYLSLLLSFSLSLSLSFYTPLSSERCEIAGSPCLEHRKGSRTGRRLLLIRPWSREEQSQSQSCRDERRQAREQEHLSCRSTSLDLCHSTPRSWNVQLLCVEWRGVLSVATVNEVVALGDRLFWGTGRLRDM